ncbi:MAG: amidohydrolase family protein [SAR202 cluster bacterium]|jgi:cytosine/adenosine deaminase-related metal-dependent hydrolase|nr:amidohydrolase family protein [SAR202 cluster bacterium]MDP6302759.1 amidohydrolase family protein [SAR202 cluster bacterium]MDP7102454.1 amidohydrolase family protein [SAR202 cluster bacterium]MDP7224858.1 amidohydrolase family protein [SAR202 cluster bacterium]MDP7413861.1 amidohydrolase family protein [SAR202 cluster bacterium]|tara:strand:- start:323 stop:1702 length:1380 start_codon:yes stop_codon:yes gene_type:complete
MNTIITKIENAAFIITVDPGRRIIGDGTILIEGNRIVRVAKADELRDPPADRVIDASDMVVTPGFVNGHMHISYAHATRGIFPDDLGPEYLPNVFALQSAMSEEEERQTSLLALTELVKHGTTTLVDPGSTKHIDACMSAYEDSGCRIVIGRHVTDRANPMNLPVYSTAEAVEITRRTIEEFDGRLSGRMRAWAMPFSPDFSTDELLLECRRLADESDTRLTLHFNLSRATTADYVSRYGVSPARRLADIRVLGPNVTLAHALGISREDVDVIADSGASAVMCPTAAIKGGAGMTSSALLPELLEAGVAVGLGTDAGNNSNLVETMRSMYLSAVLYKDGRRDVGQIPAETAVELATLRGAEALGLGDEIGSIEEGKLADLVLFDTRRVEWRTLFRPVSNLVYNADGRSVHTVIIDGRVVVEDHTPNFVDEWELIQRVQRIGEDMLARTGTRFPSRWPII